MFEIRHTNRFIKELKLSAKRGRNIKKLEIIMERLARGEVLAKQYREHNLTGQYKYWRKCQVENDWLLIYKIEQSVITFERVGTHSDLFK